MKLLAFFAYIISFGLMFFSLNLLGIDFRVFYDLPSILVIICGFIFTMVNFSFSEIYFAFRDSLAESKTLDLLNRYETDKKVLQTMGNYIVIAALISFLISSVIILENIENFRHFGAALALALLAVIYALFIKFIILVPLSTNLEKKLIAAKKEGKI